MGRTKSEDKIITPPPISPAEQNDKMIALAMRAAEQQLRDGTATSQVITHFLELGTERERLKIEKIRYENLLLNARKEALESERRTEELYKNALDAMRSYSGNTMNNSTMQPNEEPIPFISPFGR